MTLFDDASTELLLRGSGRDVDVRVAAVISDIRFVFRSTEPVVGAELAALLTPERREVAAPPLSRRRRLRASLVGKVGGAIAALVMGTGGLAVAGALPAPVQATLEHVGIGSGPGHHGPHHDGGNSSPAGPGTTGHSTNDGTIAPNGDAPSNTDGAPVPAADHSNVPQVARDNAQACDHEPSVAHAQPCTTVTIASTATTNGTTVPGEGSTTPTSDGPPSSLTGSSTTNGLHKGIVKHAGSSDVPPTTVGTPPPASNPHAHGGNQTTNGNGNNSTVVNSNGNANGKAKGHSA